MRILLIEDDTSLVRALKRNLETKGHTITTCECIGEFFEVFSEDDTFDAIITDFSLPDGTGADILQGLEAYGNTKPVLLHSGGESGYINTGQGREYVALSTLAEYFSFAQFHLKEPGSRYIQTFLDSIEK